MTTEIDVSTDPKMGEYVYVKVDGVQYKGRDVYYQRPAITSLTPVEDFNDRSTYFFHMPSKGEPRALGKYKSHMRITGGRAYDYDYHVFQFELGNIPSNDQKYIFYTDIVSEYAQPGVVSILDISYNGYPMCVFDATDKL